VRFEQLVQMHRPRSRGGSGTSTTTIVASRASTLSRASVEEAAAMPPDEAELAELRQANAHYALTYERRLAAQIVAMLPEARDEALLVLKLVETILNLPVGE
jgi:hypothetical protein